MPRPDVALPDDGLIAVVKRDCPTCALTGAGAGGTGAAWRADGIHARHPAFPDEVPQRIDDTALHASHVLGVEIVPTLIRRGGGQDIDRTYGWDRAEWNGSAAFRHRRRLPAFQPGCGALNVERAGSRTC